MWRCIPISPPEAVGGCCNNVDATFGAWLISAGVPRGMRSSTGRSSASLLHIEMGSSMLGVRAQSSEDYLTRLCPCHRVENRRCDVHSASTRCPTVHQIRNWPIASLQ